MKNNKWTLFEKANVIWHGSWSDPELEYNKKIYSYYEIEDTLYDVFGEIAEEKGIEKNEDNFLTFCKNNENIIEDIFENSGILEEL